MCKANSRVPDFLEGDLLAGVASAKLGYDKIIEIIEKYGIDAFKQSVLK